MTDDWRPRWLQEWTEPWLKCERVGHVMRTKDVSVFLYPSEGFRCIADRAVEVTPFCSRCGLTEDTRIENRAVITTLTMSTDDWDLLERTGRIVR